MTRETLATSPGRIGWLAVLLSSIGVAVYFPSRYTGGNLASLAEQHDGLAGTFASEPLAIQLAFYAHIVFAGIALLIGALQFSRPLRRRAPRVHRYIGRVYAGTVGVGGVAALVLSCFSSVAYLGFFGFGTLAVLWVWTTQRGYHAIRERDVRAHQAWMIRSFALTYAAVTLRLWLIALLLLQIAFGVPIAHATRVAFEPLPFLCWLPNIVVAEWIIARRGLPGLGMQRRETDRPAASSAVTVASASPR